MYCKSHDSLVTKKLSYHSSKRNKNSYHKGGLKILYEAHNHLDLICCCWCGCVLLCVLFIIIGFVVLLLMYRLSGLSPFFADNIQAVVEKIVDARYSFFKDQFERISQDARDFIASLLQKSPG